MNQTIQTTQVVITDLKSAVYNPRHWSDQQIANLKESITRFGLIDPIIANGAKDRFNIVIGGHMRLHCAKELGYTEVPVVYLDIPEIEREQELNLRLNRNTGEWDYNLLKEFDVDLLLDVGFDDSDLSNIWDDALEVEDDDFETIKEIEKAKTTNVREGDMFQLGRHRVICGDSTDAEVTKRLLGGKKVSMIYSDSPYNIGLNYSNGVSTKGKYGGTKVNDNKPLSDFSLWLQRALEASLAILEESGHVFMWSDEALIGVVQQLYRTVGVDNKRVCLWIKNNHNMTPQIAFNKVYEPCVYGTRGTPYLAPINNLNEILNKEVGTGNRAMEDVEDMLNIWLAKRLPGHEYQHPTEKPTTLHEKPLRRCTKPGDRVFDGFGGSGSTLIACEQLNRIAYLVELDPVFIQVIINRYEKLTGNKAKKIS